MDERQDARCGSKKIINLIKFLSRKRNKIIKPCHVCLTKEKKTFQNDSTFIPCHMFT